MTKTYTGYLAELDDLLVDTRGQVLTTEVSLSITVLAGRAVIAARAELLAEQNYERYMARKQAAAGAAILAPLAMAVREKQ